MKTAVLTDSGSAMSIEHAKAKGIFLVPLQVIDGKVSFQDGIEITTEQLFERLRQNHTPKTSMPIASIIIDTMEQIKKEGYDEVIAVPLSSGLSGTAQVMHMCAKDVHLPITIIENYTTCDLEGYIAELVHGYVKKGMKADEIRKIIDEKIKVSGTYILPNDIQHLKRGGRLTLLAATAANLLKIKPVLKIDPSTKGKIDVVGKVRTDAKATKMVLDKIYEEMKDKAGVVYVIHSDNLNKAEMIRSELKTLCPQLDIYINTISAVISAHTGLDCIAVQYMAQ